MCSFKVFWTKIRVCTYISIIWYFICKNSYWVDYHRKRDSHALQI